MNKQFKLKFTDTLSNSKREFVPQNQELTTIYACGITPYDLSHIGHARSYINFDILVRLLNFLGFQTKYLRNFTDIDDKLLKRSEEEFGDQVHYLEIAERFISDFHIQMQKLNCLEPQVEPRATEHINSIIFTIEKLFQSDSAYQLGLDVYFDISKRSDYGKLSKKNIEDLLEGSRVGSVEGKRNPGDFVLWKGNSEGMFWASPFGHGRPGWHIECSAMIYKHTQGTLDFHCGGHDLIFPHHENEIAQSESAYGFDLANFWLHNALLNLGKDKMSKSTGNSISMQDVFKKHDPQAFRFYILQHNYRHPIDFSFESLEESSKAFQKLINLFDGATIQESKETEEPIVHELIESLCDDLGTSKMIGLIFKNQDKINNSTHLKSEVYKLVTQVLGLKLNQSKVAVTPEIKKLIEKRETARKEKNWAEADRLRDQLITLGYKIQDKKL